MPRSPSTPVRVLVADDSAFMRTALTRMIESDSSLKVVATARNGQEAVEQALALDPDVMTMDIEMPVLNGLGALRQIMAVAPRPVIVVSSLSQEGAEATLEAFDLGAFDCMAKQSSRVTLNIVELRDELVSKIRAAAVARATYRARPTAPLPVEPAVTILPHSFEPSLVTIGSSTGGPKALQKVISEFPADLQVPVLVVQHMPVGFTGPFAKRLDSLSKVSVQEAVDGEVAEAGQVLIAPAGLHMTVFHSTFSKFSVRLAKTPVDTLHRPSVDVLMLSAAEAAGNAAMGVILTGMGSDGANGMKAIFDRGGFTLGQDAPSCAVYGMPRACAERGVLRRVAPLDRIGPEIVASVKRSRR